MTFEDWKRSEKKKIEDNFEPKIGKLAKLLRDHDWTYQYSNDSDMYKRGLKQEKELKRLIIELDCEWTVSQLGMAIHEQAVHFYIQDVDDTFYKQEWRDKGWNMYQPTFDELLSTDLYNKIWDWIKQQE